MRGLGSVFLSRVNCSSEPCEKGASCCRNASSSVSMAQQMVAACSGAIATSLLSRSSVAKYSIRHLHLVTPMDVVKIRLQRQAQHMQHGKCFYYHNGLMDHLCTPCERKQPCEWYQRPGNFTGTVDAFVKISRNEGVRSLWSGLSPTLVMAIPATVFYFSVYDSLLSHLRRTLNCRRQWYPNSVTPPDFTAAVVAGATARTIAVTIVSPIEMIRTKMQSEQMRYTDVGRAIRSSLAVRGWTSFYLGWAPTLMRDIPFSALYWGCYDYLKSFLMKTWDLSEPKFFVSFAAGATSGMVASVLTTPFDVIKTHRQIALGSSEISRTISTKEAFLQLTRNGGIRTLFTGIIPRVIKVAPACAIMISSYEFFKLYFAHKNKENTNKIHI